MHTKHPVMQSQLNFCCRVEGLKSTYLCRIRILHADEPENNIFIHASWWSIIIRLQISRLICLSDVIRVMHLSHFIPDATLFSAQVSVFTIFSWMPSSSFTNFRKTMVRKSFRFWFDIEDSSTAWNRKNFNSSLLTHPLHHFTRPSAQHGMISPLYFTSQINLTLTLLSRASLIVCVRISISNLFSFIRYERPLFAFSSRILSNVLLFCACSRFGYTNFVFYSTLNHMTFLDASCSASNPLIYDYKTPYNMKVLHELEFKIHVNCDLERNLSPSPSITQSVINVIMNAA